jgi:hypothetical protein
MGSIPRTRDNTIHDEPTTRDNDIESSTRAPIKAVGIVGNTVWINPTEDNINRDNQRCGRT